MRSFPDRRDGEKPFLAQICAAILALALIAAIAFLPSPALAAEPFYTCLGLTVHENRATQHVIASLGTIKASNYNGDLRGYSDNQIRALCWDTGGQAGYGWWGYNSSQKGTLVATRLITDQNGEFTEWSASWNLRDVASKLGCHAAMGHEVGFPGYGTLVSLLPESPRDARLPTIISNLAGSGTLASQLAIEVFSGVWQYLALLVSFKLFKLARG